MMQSLAPRYFLNQFCNGARGCTLGMARRNASLTLFVVIYHAVDMSGRRHNRDSVTRQIAWGVARGNSGARNLL